MRDTQRSRTHSTWRSDKSALAASDTVAGAYLTDRVRRPDDHAVPFTDIVDMNEICRDTDLKSKIIKDALEAARPAT
jgi:hypothetical protein